MIKITYIFFGNVQDKCRFNTTNHRHTGVFLAAMESNENLIKWENIVECCIRKQIKLLVDFARLLYTP